MDYAAPTPLEVLKGVTWRRVDGQWKASHAHARSDEALLRSMQHCIELLRGATNVRERASKVATTATLTWAQDTATRQVEVDVIRAWLHACQDVMRCNSLEGLLRLRRRRDSLVSWSLHPLHRRGTAVRAAARVCDANFVKAWQKCAWDLSRYATSVSALARASAAVAVLTIDGAAVQVKEVTDPAGAAGAPAATT